MTIFGFDLNSTLEIWLLGNICVAFATGFARGFYRAWKEHKEQKKGVEHNA